MIIIFFILVIGYCLAMLILGFGIFKSQRKKEEKPKDSFRNISIIIPFFREEKNLKNLITQLNKIQYPEDKFEVIFINDGSSKNENKEINQNSNKTHVIHWERNNKGKKKSLITGVKNAKNNTIFVTDADCNIPSDILHRINNSTDNISIGITIKESSKNSILHKFQEIESQMLAGVTIGSCELGKPLLCNGANLAFSKTVFEELNPYKNNLEIKSGDDMFLLESAIQKGKKIGLRSGGIVSTKTKKSWKSYFQQSTRWSAKTKRIKIPGLRFFNYLTFLANLVWLIALIGCIIKYDENLLTLVLIKFFVDLLFLFLTSLYTKKYKLILFAPLVGLLYPIYLLVLGAKILTYKEEWFVNE